MRRLYVTTKDVWEGQALDLSGKPLVHHIPVQAVRKDDKGNSKTVTEHQEVPFRHIDLFDPRVGSAYLILDDSHILVSTDTDHSEYCQEIWHNHPEVAVLPHPVYEGKVQLHELGSADHAAKRFKKKHLDSLMALKTLSAAGTDTVITLAKKASRLQPLVKLASFS